MSDSFSSGSRLDEEEDSLCETSNSSGDELEADDNMEEGWLAAAPSFHLSLHTSSERATTDGGGRGIRHRSSSSSSREGRANENSEEGEDEEEEGGLLMHWTDWSNESDVVGSSDEEEPLAAEARYPSGMSTSDREAQHDGHSSKRALPVPSTNTNSSSTAPPRIPSTRRSAAELSWIADLVPRVSEDAIDRLVADALWSNEILISSTSAKEQEEEGIRRPSYPLCVFLSESISRFRQEHHHIETVAVPQDDKKPSSSSSFRSSSRSTTISRCCLVLQQALLAHYQLSCEVQHLSRTAAASSPLDETQHHVVVDDTECATKQTKKHHHDDYNTRFLTEFVGLWKCKMSDGWMHRHWRQLEVDALLTAHRIAVVHQQTRQPQPPSFPSRPHHEADDVDAEMLKDEHDSLTLLAIAATSLFRGNRSEAASGSSCLLPPPSPFPRSHHDAPPPPPLSTPLPSCWFPRTRLLLGGGPSSMTGDDANDHGGGQSAATATTPPPTTLQSLLDQWTSGVEEEDEDCSSRSRSGRNIEPLSSVRQQSATKRVRLLFTNWLSYLRVALRWLLESAREALRELQQHEVEEGVTHSSGEAAVLQSIVEEALRSPGGWLFMTTTTALPNNNAEWLDEALEMTDSRGRGTEEEEESNRRRFLVDRYFAHMTALKQWVTSLHDDGRGGGDRCSTEEEKEEQPPLRSADGKRPTPITGSKRGVRLENCLRHSTRRQPTLCDAITKKCGDKDDDDDDDDAAGTNDDCDARRLERIYHRYRQASSDALHNNNNYVGGSDLLREGLLLSSSAAVAQLPSLTQRRNANLREPMFLRLHDEADAADPLQSEQWEGGRALVQWLPAIRQFLLS